MKSACEVQSLVIVVHNNVEVIIDSLETHLRLYIFEVDRLQYPNLQGIWLYQWVVKVYSQKVLLKLELIRGDLKGHYCVIKRWKLICVKNWNSFFTQYLKS